MFSSLSNATVENLEYQEAVGIYQEQHWNNKGLTESPNNMDKLTLQHWTLPKLPNKSDTVNEQLPEILWIKRPIQWHQGASVS